MPIDHDPDTPGVQDICPIDGEAKRILTSLTDEVGFPIPDPDLDGITFPNFEVPDFDLPVQISNPDLTQVELEGTGTFDVFMRAIALHMDREYKGGRITGAEYAKTYTALVQGAMGQAVQFLLGKDAAYWQAIAAQQQAKLVTGQLVAAQVELSTAKVNLALAQNQANNAKAEYALTVAKLATEEVSYCSAKYSLNEILPTQAANLVIEGENLTKQGLMITAQTDQVTQQTENLVSEKLLIEANTVNAGKQGNLLDEQVLQATAETSLIGKNELMVVAQTSKVNSEKLNVEANTLYITAQKDHLTNYEGPKSASEKLLIDANKLKVDEDKLFITAQRTHLTTLEGPKTTAETALIEQNTANALAQHAVIVEQENLTKEQTETQRAQTMDTRTDGTTIVEGAIGKQKDLQAQQIVSYQRDAEVKAGKMWVDAWITMKTIDEGILPPTNFTNVKVDEVLSAIKTNNAI